MYPALAFVAGIVILLICADFFVTYASRLSLALRLSPLVIGITVVAIGTSLPELVVSGISAVQGDGGLAFGNIIGSNIVNILLIFPLGILFGQLRIGTMKTQRNTLILLLVSMGFFFLARLFALPYLGWILIAAAVIFTVEEYRWGTMGRYHEDKKKLVKKHAGFSLKSTLPGIALSVLGIIVGGIITVVSVEQLSALTTISTTILGFTLTAVCTSLPELFTTLFSARHNEEKISLGNILGSNIYNVLLIGGIATLVADAGQISIEQWGLFLLSSVVLTGTVAYYRGRVVPKWVGFVLLTLFFCSMYYVSRT